MSAPERPAEEAPQGAQLPAVVQEAPGVLSTLRHPGQFFLSNLDPKNPMTPNRLLRALAPPDRQLGGNAPIHLSVVAYVAVCADVPISKTGELQERAIVTLVCEDGTTFGWSSPTTTRFFSVLLGVKGPGPWNPPLKIVLRPRPGKLQGFWYSVELDEEIDPQPINQRKGK